MLKTAYFQRLFSLLLFSDDPPHGATDVQYLVFICFEIFFFFLHAVELSTRAHRDQNYYLDRMEILHEGPVCVLSPADRRRFYYNIYII